MRRHVGRKTERGHLVETIIRRCRLEAVVVRVRLRAFVIWAKAIDDEMNERMQTPAIKQERTL